MVNCKITIDRNRATISGVYPIDIIRNATSYYVPGYKFNPAFRAKKWDGKEHLFKGGHFPAGLTNLVIKELKIHDETSIIEFIDNRETTIPDTQTNGFELNGIDFGKDQFDYQIGAAEACLKHKRGILKIATNGGKTAISIAVTKHLKIPTIFLVDGLELLYQTRRNYAKLLNISEESIGVIGDGECTIGRWITVSSPGTLYSRLAEPKIAKAIEKWQLLWADECHRAAADTSYKCLDALQCYYRFGLSGTPLMRSDGADLKLIAQTGDVIYEVSNKLLVDRGISVQPYVEMIKITEPLLPKTTSWQEAHRRGVVENDTLNKKIASKVEQHVAIGSQVLVCLDTIKHGNIIDSLVPNHVPHQFINGQEDSEVRQLALEEFVKGKIRCLIATSILDQGVDIPNIDVLIFAGGGKAKIRTLQRAGRGLRKGNGKDKLLIIDFSNFSHRYLLKHSLERLETYRKEECFKISVGS